MDEEVCNDILITKCIYIYILNKDYDKSSKLENLLQRK